jgi:hypothetical protein
MFTKPEAEIVLGVMLKTAYTYEQKEIVESIITKLKTIAEETN